MEATFALVRPVVYSAHDVPEDQHGYVKVTDYADLTVFVLQSPGLKMPSPFAQRKRGLPYDTSSEDEEEEEAEGGDNGKADVPPPAKKPARGRATSPRKKGSKGKGK